MEVVNIDLDENVLVHVAKVKTEESVGKDYILCIIKIDTGAANTIIGKDLVSDKVLNSLKFTEEASTLGGKVKTAPAVLRLLGIEDNTFGDLKVHVHQNWERGTYEGKKILIGMDILKYFDFDFDSKTLVLKISLQEKKSNLPFKVYKNTKIENIKFKSKTKESPVKGFLGTYKK